MRIEKRIFRRRGFMMIDMLAGIILLTAMATMLAASAGLRERNAQHLSDQRAALQIAEQTLFSGKAPEKTPAQITIRRSTTRIGQREWIEVSVLLNGRHATLAGLVPAGGAK